MSPHLACMRLLACSMGLLVAGGCVTNLQQADRRYAEARYEEASRYYLREYNAQRQSAMLPQWRGQRYNYVFNAASAAAGLLGAAKSADAMGRHEQATLLRARLAAFCQRQSLPMDWADASAEGKHEPTP